jgi:transposase InsO family protein
MRPGPWTFSTTGSPPAAAPGPDHHRRLQPVFAGVGSPLQLLRHRRRRGSGAGRRGPGLPGHHPGQPGAEFVSRDLDLWPDRRGVTLDFSRPGKPTDNSFIESFNGKFRAECLNAPLVHEPARRPGERGGLA